MNSFSNKTVWITGASAGIGKALSIAFSKLGANIILSARRETELIKVSKLCIGDGWTKIVVLDMLNFQLINTEVQTILDQGINIDILINNAGVSQRSFAKSTVFEVDKSIMDLNYLSVVAMTKALLPNMIEQKEAYILATSSLVGKFGSPFRSTYSASKHALHGFFDSLRTELIIDKTNVKVMLFCPGFVNTDVSLNALTEDGSQLREMDVKTSTGVSPSYVAKKVISGIRRNKAEIYIGRSEILYIYISRLFPGIFRYLISKTKVR